MTLGILFALQGGYFRAFYLWLKRGYDDLFARLTQCPLLQCLLRTQQGWCCRLLAAASFFAVIDSYPIKLLFPIRQGGSPQQVGKKGLDKGCWLLYSTGHVVERDHVCRNGPVIGHCHLLSFHYELALLVRYVSVKRRTI